MSGQGDEVSPTTMVVNKDGLDKNIAESNEEHVRQIEIQETRLSGNKGTTRGARLLSTLYGGVEPSLMLVRITKYKH